MAFLDNVKTLINNVNSGAYDSTAVKLQQTLANGPFPTTFGSIGGSWGATNLDSIPSSGGTAGYTKATTLQPPTPTPIVYIPNVNTFGGAGVNQGSGNSGTTNSGGSGTTQSGDLTGDVLDKFIALYGNQFQAPSQASTSGGGVVVVPQGSSDSTAPAATSSPVSPQLLGIVALAAVAFFAYRHFHKGA